MKITRDTMIGGEREPGDLVAAIVAWWIDNHPEARLQFSLPHLGMMAEGAAHHAARFGIRTQPEVCAFANLMWLYGPRFDRVPSIERILASRGSAMEKVRALYLNVPDRDWDEAARARDEDAWLRLVPGSDGEPAP